MSEQQEPADTFDVAILGYGPTGLALAYWLGRAGHKTVVIERWPDLYALPRAGHVDGEVMRLLQKMGVGETIAGDSSITTHTVIRDSKGESLVKIPAEPCDQGWASHYSLFQPKFEQALDERVRSTGNVTVLQGWQAENITGGNGAQVRIELASGVADGPHWVPTGKNHNVTASWLIGADGANSIVADFVGAAVEDLGYQARALVIFAERLDPSVGSDMPDAEVGMMPTRPYVALRESGKRFARWEFFVHPDESNDEMGAADKAWELIAPWGFSQDNARLVRHTVYEFRTLIAEDWRKDNVLLAGDAAHRMPPHMGQGMCSGQRDAAALAWRLDLVLRGLADRRLLDSYTGERRPHVLALTMNSVERAQQFWVADPKLALERDEKMRRGLAGENVRSTYGSVPVLTAGVLRTGPDGPLHPAGHLSPQFLVRSSGDDILLDDCIGPNWLLIAADPSEVDALDESDHAFLERLGARVWVLGESSDLDDSGASYACWLKDLGASAAVVRPDSYIFGCSRGPADLQAMVADLRTKLWIGANEVSR